MKDEMMCNFQRGDGITGGDHNHTEVAGGCQMQCLYGQKLRMYIFEEAISEEYVPDSSC
jgi:hypothetical protein